MGGQPQALPNFWDLSTDRKKQSKMGLVSLQPLLCPAKENEAVW